MATERGHPLDQIIVESRLFRACALPSSTEVPVLLLNQPIMRTPSFHNYLWVAGNQGKSITRVILQHNISLCMETSLKAAVRRIPIFLQVCFKQVVILAVRVQITSFVSQEHQ